MCRGGTEINYRFINAYSDARLRRLRPRPPEVPSWRLASPCTNLCTVGSSGAASLGVLRIPRRDSVGYSQYCLRRWHWLQVRSGLSGGGGPQAILRFRQNKQASAGFLGGVSFLSSLSVPWAARGDERSGACEGTIGGTMGRCELDEA